MTGADWLSDKSLLSDFRAYKERGHSDHLLILYSLVSYLDKPVVVEIGVRDGRSSRSMLAAMEYVGGHLYSCDVNPKCSESVPMEYRGRWTFFGMPSEEFFLKWNKKIDLLFIDGNHRYEFAKADFNNFSPWVKPHGFIVMHDAKPSHHTDVARVLSEMDKDKWAVSVFNIGAGTAVIQRKG